MIPPDEAAQSPEPPGTAEPRHPGTSVDDTSLWTQRLLRALTFLPPLVILALITRYAVNVPFHDEWGWSVRHVMEEQLLNLDLAPFWKLNNEHRIFVPTILGAALGHLTNLDMRGAIVAKWFLTLCTALVLGSLARRQAPKRGNELGPLLLTLSLFGLSQWPRWIDVRPLPSTLSILSLAGGLWLLCLGPRNWRTWLAAVACAWVSSSSYFSGNMTWVVMGLAMIVLGWGARAWIAWFLCAGIVAVEYLIDFWNTPTLTGIGGERNPLELLQFILIFLGAGSSTAHRGLPNQTEALLYGAFGLIAFVALGASMMRRSKSGLERATPWLALGLWVFLNALATAYGRLPSAGLGGARAWRYTVFPALFWAALSILAANLLFEPTATPRSRSRSVALGSIILLCMGFVGGTLGMLDSGGLDGYPRRMRQGRAKLLLDERSALDLSRSLMPDVEWYRQNLDALIERKASFLYGERSWMIHDANRHNAVGVSYESVSGAQESVYQVSRKASIGWRETILDRPYAYVSFRLASRVEGRETHVSVLVRGPDFVKTAMECRTSAGLGNRETFKLDVSEWVGQEITVRFRCQADSQQAALLLSPKLIYDILDRDPQ